MPLGRRRAQDVVDRGHDRGHLRDAGDASRRRVEPAPGCPELADRAHRVATCDERSDRRAPTKPLRDDLRPDVEPDCAPAAEEPPSAARIDDRSAAGRDDSRQLRPGVDRPERVDRRALTAPESSLALGLEDLRDAHARLALDLLVEVDERRVVARRDPPPDRGLATAGQADDDQLHA